MGWEYAIVLSTQRREGASVTHENAKFGINIFVIGQLVSKGMLGSVMIFGNV